jgi:hypothetical protein
LCEVRNAERQHNTDDQQRYQQFVQGKAGLGSFFHASNILRGIQGFPGSRRAAELTRQAVDFAASYLT